MNIYVLSIPMLINTQVAREVLEHHGHKNKNWNEVSDKEKKECIPTLRERLNLPFALMPEDEEPFYLWIFASAIRADPMIQPGNSVFGCSFPPTTPTIVAQAMALIIKPDTLYNDLDALWRAFGIEAEYAKKYGILPIYHYDTSSNGSLDRLYLTRRKWKWAAPWEDDPPGAPLQWTLLDPEGNEEQLLLGIASDLGRKVEISPRGSLLRFLSRFEPPLHVEVSGKKQSEVWGAVGMAHGTVPVRKIFNGMYYEYLRSLYSNANKYTSCERGIGTSRP